MANAKPNKHWLYEWIDEFEVHNSDAARSRMSDRQALARLQALASANTEVDYSAVPQTGAIVAGPGLEISSRATCTEFPCRKRNLDTEMGQLLHFYDCVVMQGPEAIIWRNYPEGLRDKNRRENIIDEVINSVATLNYIRDSGLSNHILFANREDCFCDTHFKQFAHNMGLDELADESTIERQAKEISRAGAVEIFREGPRLWWGSVTNPLFSDSLGTPFRRKTRPKKYEVAEKILSDQLKSIVFDMAAAKAMDLPISSVATPSFFDGRAGADSITVDDVATRIHIPILSDVPATDVVKLRERTPEDFEAFRSALREAIAISIESSSESSPDKIAEIVWHERLKPAVADIERRMNANKQAFSIMSAATITIGFAAAAVTSFTAIPWIVAMLGTTAMAATVPVPYLNEFAKERRQIRNAPLYFLWKAQKEQIHR